MSPEPDSELDVATASRLPRAERREQILVAATRAFARAGFAATSLEDVASEAGISRVILYRHFDSKADLYRAVLDRVCSRLVAEVGDRNFTDAAIAGLAAAAAADPDGFRLLFQHAAREPEFLDQTSQLRAGMTAVAHAELAEEILDPLWVQWAARLCPVVTIEAILAWLDAGQPNPDQVADRICHAVDAVIQAAQPVRSTTSSRA